MEVVYARCAGLDVHKKKILAWCSIFAPIKEIKPELLAMSRDGLL